MKRGWCVDCGGLSDLIRRRDRCSWIPLSQRVYWLPIPSSTSRMQVIKEKAQHLGFLQSQIYSSSLPTYVITLSLINSLKSESIKALCPSKLSLSMSIVSSWNDGCHSFLLVLESDAYNLDIPAMSLTKMDFCGKISCCNTSGPWGVGSPQGRNDHWSETKPGSMLVNIGAPVCRQHWREILGKIWKKYNCENERNTVDKHWRPVCH